MKTVFLAAGQSSRMEPLKHKNFFEFSGFPLLIRVAFNAYSAGLRNFVFVINSENFVKMQALVQKYEFTKGSEVVIQEDFDKGQAGAVEATKNILEAEDPVLMLNGNDFVDKEVFKEILELQKEKEVDGALVCKKMQNYFPGGYIEKDENNKIISIVEKPKEGEEPSDLVNIVIHYFKKSSDLFEALEKSEMSENDDDYEVALDFLFKNKNFKAIGYEGDWGALKFPWHALTMMESLWGTQKEMLDLSEFNEVQKGVLVHKEAFVEDSVKFKGENIVVDKGAKIFDYAVISSPVYLGKNSIVGNQALVRNSIIGEKSVVGYSTEVARSFLGKNVSSHMAYIGDSIVGDNVNFGAYSCTANLRLDKKTIRVKVKEDRIDSGFDKLGAIIGKGAQIGIGAKLMPGCKVPAKELVRPGEIWF